MYGGGQGHWTLLLPLPLRAPLEGDVAAGRGAWGGRLRRSLPPRARPYQLAGAQVTDDAHVHPEAVGEGGLQVDVALPVVFWQLAHVRPVRVLDGPKLNLVGALQGPCCQPSRPLSEGPWASSFGVCPGPGPRPPAPCLLSLGAENSHVTPAVSLLLCGPFAV